ncbi:unnamed protein product [Amoebophrya sp. A25]|nr:unnamed protein product [Amoebophrya sp. A25]|eukprot:GSA25T00006429001.1
MEKKGGKNAAKEPAEQSRQTQPSPPPGPQKAADDGDAGGYGQHMRYKILDSHEEFQNTLHEVLVRMALNYPFEALPLLRTQQNADKVIASNNFLAQLPKDYRNEMLGKRYHDPDQNTQTSSSSKGKPRAIERILQDAQERSKKFTTRHADTVEYLTEVTKFLQEVQKRQPSGTNRNLDVQNRRNDNLCAQSSADLRFLLRILRPPPVEEVLKAAGEDLETEAHLQSSRTTTADELFAPYCGRHIDPGTRILSALTPYSIFDGAGAARRPSTGGGGGGATNKKKMKNATSSRTGDGGGGPTSRRAPLQAGEVLAVLRDNADSIFTDPRNVAQLLFLGVGRSLPSISSSASSGTSWMTARTNTGTSSNILTTRIEALSAMYDWYTDITRITGTARGAQDLRGPTVWKMPGLAAMGLPPRQAAKVPNEEFDLKKHSLVKNEHSRIWPVLTTHSNAHYHHSEDDLTEIWPDLFNFVGSGISNPRYIEVVDRRGRVHRQLIKGNDDPRQDALVQQSFKLCSEILLDNDADQEGGEMHHHGALVDHVENPTSSLLSKSAGGGSGGAWMVDGTISTMRARRKMRRRPLALRTYKVIPLAPFQGVMEWVRPTIPFKDWAGDAHEYYFPEDLRPFADSSLLSNPFFVDPRDPNAPKVCPLTGFDRQGRSTPDAVRIKVYQAIMQRTHPALPFFFLERFPGCSEWLAATRNFATSVATTSIVGYIFGIGDRHCSNILLDPASGQVVHIDFGMIFDHASIYLRIREMVPFRMTPDFVAALGCQGLKNALFRGSFESTLHALRGNMELLSTICEVFLVDPVAKWCVEQDTVCNADAEHALTGMREKLLDFKDPLNLQSFKGNPSAFIAHLLNQATSIENLGTIFSGWAAWC